MIINVCYFPTATGVVIGFEEPEVQVPEDITDGVKLLCVKVFEGELMREASVTVQYFDHTAVGKYLNTLLTLFC